MENEFVTKLIEDLRKRREELEGERTAITAALRALEGAPRRRGQRQRDLPSALVQSLAASPGSRASLLALEFGLSPAVVSLHLQDLERSGKIVKQGLGWRLAPSTGA
jgi:hypothetical protein